MKYAFMTFSTPELPLAEVLAVARRFGYDGVEPRLDAGHAHGVETNADAGARARIRETVEDAGVPLLCLASSLRYADPAAHAEIIEQTHARIDLAGDLHVPVMRVFGGTMGTGLDRAAAVAAVATALQAVADHAAERDVTLCVETHDDWCNPRDMAAVMQAVDHPAIAVNWDIMHPVRMGFATIDESFAVLRPWIRHLHVHDGITTDKLELTPIGEGDIDHRRALELMAQTDFDGCVSGEWIGWEPYETHLPRELATLRRYDRERT